MRLKFPRAALIAVVAPGIKNRFVRTVADAHGLLLECPATGCKGRIIAWFDTFPATGTTLDDLSIGGTIEHACGWRGTVSDGEVEAAPAEP